jgi:acetyl esterase/lipase
MKTKLFLLLLSTSILFVNGQNLGKPKNNTDEVILNNLPEGVVAEFNIPYREGNQRWKMDLFRPEKVEKSTPAIIFIHGGGFTSGDKRNKGIIRLAMNYAAQGYVCTAVNYRLSKKGRENRLPGIKDAIADTKCAVRWMRANAKKYNINPERIGAFGNSAGAHLVCMLGLSPSSAGLEGNGPHTEFSSMVQAVAAASPPTDLNLFIDEELPQEYKPLVKQLSPISYVSAESPPFVIFHDESDYVVSVDNSKSFVAALDKAGAKNVKFMLYDNNSGHGAFIKNAKETIPLLEEFYRNALKK